LILLSGFTFYAFTQDVTQHYNNTMSAMNDVDWNRNQEEIIIKQIVITGTYNLNITVENDGSIQSHLIWLGLFNRTASPENQTYQELNEFVAPSEIDNIISTFTVAAGNKYVVQLVTERGNVVESKFYPASYVRCALTLVTAPPTVYQGNNVTVLLTVTPNDTVVDFIQSLNVTINATPVGRVQRMDNSSLFVNGLARGTSAYFWWIYNAATAGTVTFNASYALAPGGTYALATLQILSARTLGNITLTGPDSTPRNSYANYTVQVTYANGTAFSGSLFLTVYVRGGGTINVEPPPTGHGQGGASNNPWWGWVDTAVNGLFSFQFKDQSSSGETVTVYVQVADLIEQKSVVVT
jgi:hypothetical protein